MLRIRFLLLLLLFVIAETHAQQSSVDSLRALLANPTADTFRLLRLDAIISELGPNEEGRRYNDELGSLSKKLSASSDSAIARAAQIYYASYLGNSGYIAEKNGDIPGALAAYQEALPILRKAGRSEAYSSVLSNVGFIYNGLGNIPRAVEYYQQALAIRETSGDKYGLATSMNNLATLYRDQGETDKALDYFGRFREICISIHDSSGIALAETNIGNMYLMQKDTVKAFSFLDEALSISRSIGDNQRIGHALFSLGNLKFNNKRYEEAISDYEESTLYYSKAGYKQGIVNSQLRLAETCLLTGNSGKALTIAKDAHEMAQNIGYPDLIENSARTLKEIYKSIGDDKMALQMYELEVQLRDSLVNESNRKLLLRNELESEYNKKKAALATEQEKAELKVQRETIIRNFALGVLAVVLIFLVLVVVQRNRIARERKRSDNLLLNILPEEVADELKEKGHAETHAFPEVTVLFTDFKGFTQISERLSPKALVQELDRCFRTFDTIMEKHGIEKIKTIGDSYMAAGGLPVANKTHATDVVTAAMEINAFMKALYQKKKAEGKEAFEIRIGVHTGPVVAGIVGMKKFAYDIWGDTVNTASRMESSGEPGRVNISQSTYLLVKHLYNCSPRGKIIAKNKGEIEMYFVDGLKDES